ncbi:MAG: inositol monophosphatase family protein [Pseudomonadota bacterium]
MLVFLSSCRHCPVMHNHSFKLTSEFADRLADMALSKTLPLFRSDLTVDNKSASAFDPVTDADRQAEQILRQEIEKQFPNHGIVGEEFGSKNADASLRWVLDPIDGTKAFITGIPTWTTLIGFEQNATPIFGLVDQPFTGDRWFGGLLDDDKDANTNSDTTNAFHRRQGKTRSINVSSCTALSEARLTTTDPRSDGYFTPPEANAFAAVASRTKLQRFGLDAYGYALVAEGQFDLAVEAGLACYDYSAPVALVRAAGGVVTDWRGKAPGADDTGRIIAAATESLHAEALEILSKVP